MPEIHTVMITHNRWLCQHVMHQCDAKVTVKAFSHYETARAGPSATVLLTWHCVFGDKDNCVKFLLRILHWLRRTATGVSGSCLSSASSSAVVDDGLTLGSVSYNYTERDLSCSPSKLNVPLKFQSHIKPESTPSADDGMLKISFSRDEYKPTKVVFIKLTYFSILNL